jgi:hypothetical protein
MFALWRRRILLHLIKSFQQTIFLILLLTCFNAWISPAFVIASTISIVSFAIIRTSKITRKDPNLGILDTRTLMLHAIATMLRFLLLEKSLRQSRRERERESFPNPCEEKEEASPLVKTFLSQNI